jgi:hypothetical protein
MPIIKLKNGFFPICKISPLTVKELKSAPIALRKEAKFNKFFF